MSDEIKELFQYIGRYKPHSATIDSKLKPFIPDYIPAIGDIDEFIKVPRPDGKPDDLGLKVLDEPAAKQSDTVRRCAKFINTSARPLCVESARDRVSTP